MSEVSSVEYSDSEIARTYDETLYENKSFPESHPGRLAAIAILMGMSPPNISECRVLEIGCALGGNLIPMAYHLPNSEFVGLDISAAQVASAQQTCAELNLQNCQIKQISVLDFAETEPFDYIIAHGVYSWVSDPVKHGIMEICDQLLSANGVAYISHNVYPGWSQRKSLRDTLLFHLKDTADPQIKASKARMFLEFLAESASDGPYKMFLKSEQKFFSNHSDNYLVHEYLELYNDPVFFHEFVRRAESRNLQYLGDAAFGSGLISNFPPHVHSMLRRLASDRIQQEQYIDFIRNRAFRSSLLCRSNLKVSDERNHSRLKSLWVGLSEYHTPKDTVTAAYLDKIKSQSHEHNEPISRIAKALTNCSPGLLNFENLETITGLDQQPNDVSLAIRHLHDLGIVTLHTTSNSVVNTISTKPIASRLAVHQAKLGTRVVNSLHTTLILSDFTRKLLAVMNGENDRSAIIEIMKSCPFTRESNNNDMPETESSFELFVDKQMDKIRKLALLIG